MKFSPVMLGILAVARQLAGGYVFPRGLIREMQGYDSTAVLKPTAEYRTGDEPAWPLASNVPRMYLPAVADARTVGGLTFPLANTAMVLGSSDFTIAFFVLAISTPDGNRYGLLDIGGGYNYSHPNIRIQCYGTTALTIAVRSANTNGGPDVLPYTNYDAGGGIDAGRGWQHIAMTRKGDVLRAFIGGVKILETTLPAGTLIHAQDNDSGFNLASTGPDAERSGSPTFGVPGFYTDLVFSKTCLYTDNYTPPAVPSTIPSVVVLLMHFNGTNGQTTTVDSSPSARPLTGVNGFQITDHSALFNQAGDFRSSGSTRVDIGGPVTDFDYGSDDFCIEFAFFYEAVAAGYQYLFEQTTSGTAVKMSARFADGGFSNRLQVSTLDSSLFGVYYVANLTKSDLVGAWHRMAITRSSGKLRVFLDGVLQTLTAAAGSANGTAITWTEPVVGTTAVHFGSAADGNAMLGQMDEVRVTKGAARYVANYTPATAEFDTTPVVPTAYRYYRIYITANNGADYTAIQEIELRGTSGGADLTTPSMTATASSSYPGNGPEKAFDGDTTSPATGPWISNSGLAVPSWVGIDLGSAMTVAEVTLLMQAEAQYLGRAPKDFQVQGSSDGTTWNTVKSFTGVTDWQVGVPKVLTVGADAAVAVTFDPTKTAGSGMTLSSDKLTLNAAEGKYMLATLGRTTGKWYAEFLFSTVPGGSAWAVLVRDGQQTYDAIATDEAVLYGSEGISAGDVIGVAFDADSHKVDFYRNGTLVKTKTGLTADKLMLGAGQSFGSAATYVVKGRFTKSAMTGTIPSGFTAWDGTTA